MPRLPGAQDVQQVGYARDPGVSVPQPVSSGLEYVAEAVGGIAKVEEGIRRRDENLRELNTADALQLELQTMLSNAVTSGDLTSDRFIEDFRSSADELVNKRISTHEGSAESRARLQEKVGRMKQSAVMNLAVTAHGFRRKEQGKRIDSVVEASRKVAYDAGLSEGLVDFSNKFSELRDGLPDWEAAEVYKAGTKEVARSHINSILLKSIGNPDAINGVAEVISSEGIREILGESTYQDLNQQVATVRTAAAQNLVAIQREKDKIRFQTDEAIRLERVKAGFVGTPKMGTPEWNQVVRAQVVPLMAIGKATPEQAASVRQALSNTLQLDKDALGYPVFKNATMDENLAIIKNPDHFPKNWVEAAKRSIDSGGISSGIGVVQKPPLDQTIVGMIHNSPVPLSGVRGKYQGAKELIGVDGAGAPRETIIRATDAAIESIKFGMKSSEGRPLAKMYEELGKAFDVNARDVVRSDERTEAEARSGNLIAYRNERILEAQLDNPNLTYSDRVDLNAAISEVRALRDMFATSFRTVLDAQAKLQNMDIKKLKPTTPVFIEASVGYTTVGELLKGASKEPTKTPQKTSPTAPKNETKGAPK